MHNMLHYKTTDKTIALNDYLTMSKMKMFVDTLTEKLKTASGIYQYGNPIEIPVIRKNQFRVLRSLKLENTD